jgi:ATP-binding cassette subfamily B protein
LASVDNSTAAGILAEVRLQRNRTVLMISHQLSAAAACDRILVLEEGRLVQEGHHRDLVGQAGAYRRLWEREEAKKLQGAA